MLKDSPDRLHKILEEWERAVEEYTTRNLGRSTDRLVALGAIIELFSNLFGTKYVAGLWESYLHINLNWFVQSDTPPKPLPSSPQAPQLVQGICRQ
jgi:hypothetical protein